MNRGVLGALAVGSALCIAGGGGLLTRAVPGSVGLGVGAVGTALLAGAGAYAATRGA